MPARDKAVQPWGFQVRRYKQAYLRQPVQRLCLAYAGYYNDALCSRMGHAVSAGLPPVIIHTK
jgi:hypothetical protein